ncbi:THO complex subunit THOC1 [Penicillium robsamsonii]|uniref:THO complex subunit THOC1 n=1 Tax=Penicillium robsamsonii TaxID=1792511 RepID=UPI0025489CA3|nr:THO complex subunit THOC1 [Penicillium robsamsonii]KAJ5824303.1 THO complex subunit THOC1 [Penicillium robsamsonii]
MANEEDVAGVQVYKRLVDSLLDRAAQVKPDKQIEPPLTETHLGESIWQVPSEDDNAIKHLSPQTKVAAVEIAFREKFYRILASTSIDDPAFIQIWNLLDIVSIFSDNEQCEPGLIFWLIEELLDSQTINGCRKVFDYLESRRERNTKKKHFKQKSLVILRSCNELLRRLSRAEDTVFCGRVFIYLFQSFPLGDKSSVNLRGEFHSENVTTFDEIANESTEKQEQDTTMTEGAEPAAPGGAEAGQAEIPSQQTSKVPKVVVSTGDGKKSDDVDLNALYPLFWSLQAYFSAPSKMFDAERFTSFKTGMEATLAAFKNINTEMENESSARASEDARKSNKRKRIADGTEVATSFNPKYLTSRDLFDLEISDTAFRRHVLVQALILLDFLLSLTSKSKSRLADTTNKSVLYGFTLNEEDTKWAISMRKGIEGYLQQGPGGKFYYRMVDTVLSRDKNWVRWKAEGCPLIERPAISAAEYTASREHATKAYANKRLRPSPMGSLDLKFLADTEALATIERLKESGRYSVPSADSFLKGIMDDEMDIDMAMTDEDKAIAEGAKASKSWRILRLAAKGKLAAFDKIGEGNNLQVLFESATATEDNNELSSSGDTKDLPQSLDGSQDMSAKEPVGDKEPAEAGEAPESEEPVQDEVKTADESGSAQDRPQSTDDQEMQVENKDVISEEQAIGTDDTEEALAAASASKENSAT